MCSLLQGFSTAYWDALSVCKRMHAVGGRSVYGPPREQAYIVWVTTHYADVTWPGSGVRLHGDIDRCPHSVNN